MQYVYGYVSISLETLFDTKNGYTPSKNNREYWNDNADIAWFRMEDIRDNGRILFNSAQHITQKAVKGNLFPKNSIIVSTSATIGEYALIKIPFLANQRFTALMLKDEFREIIDINYIFYYCSKLSIFCKEHLNKGNFASVDMTAFKNFQFCIPTIEEQNRIVSILDRFDSLCNDMKTGLPAEISARQQQYEYYRDKLLTFRKKDEL